MSLPPGTRLGQYEVSAPLGAGGMGEVYRARDAKLGREVAIKVLPVAFATDAERLARFTREAQVLAALNHPNIGAIYGLEESEDQRFLVLELVEGEDLAARLARGPLPVDEALPLARQIAEALEAAHDKGIVHRDLKPANVKLRPDGTVKVLDFGLAKAWAGDSATGSSADVSQSPTLAHTGTATGIILGTAAYMSPEQARGRAVDKRSDIWAFGVVLWEMLTGARLFAGETISDVLAAVLTHEPQWPLLPRQLPRSVRDLLRRTLVRNPKQRLHDIADARILLDEAIASPVEVVPQIVAARDVSPAPRYRWLLAALAALALVTAVLGWLVVRGSSRAPHAARSLSVVLPENLQLVDDSNGALAMSPDGTRVVIAASGEESERLYVRELGSPELKPIAGTDDGSGPFFSPDGRWVAFVGNGLRKVPLDGGDPIALAPSSFGVGTWSQAGDIYYTPDFNAGLHRISAAGGTPQPLTKPDPAKGELNHSFPELLPGGQVLLFTNHRATVAESRIEALVLASGERRVVVEHAIEARYLAPGYLTFVREEALMVAPFDAGTLQLTGPALPARQQVAVSYLLAHGEYAVSAGDTLALVPRSVMPPRREVVRLDRAGRAETVLAAEKTYSGPALSPDGRRLALTRNERGPDLLLYDLERKTMTRLAGSPRREFGSVWDRSGARIFHVVDLPLFQIFSIAADGAGGPTRIAEDTRDQLPQDVSPDGQSLLYLYSGHVNRRSLGIMPLASPKDAHLLGGLDSDESFGRFSPDGRFVAFQSDESGQPEVYVQSVTGATRPVPVSTGGGEQPRWARNGELFFWRGPELVVLAVRTSPALSVGTPQVLFRTSRPATNWFESDYDVSADGQSIYLARVPDLLRPREVRIVIDWASDVTALVASGGGE